MEADLQRFYGIDYRDRWRGDLTLRRIAVLIRHLPGESATFRVTTGRVWWSLTDQLLDDLRRQVAVLAGADDPPPHPSRQVARTATPDRPDMRRKIAALRARDAARKALLAKEGGP